MARPKLSVCLMVVRQEDLLLNIPNLNLIYIYQDNEKIGANVLSPSLYYIYYKDVCLSDVFLFFFLPHLFKEDSDNQTGSDREC